MVSAFDARGQQIPECQGRYADVCRKIISDAPEGAVFERFKWPEGFTAVAREEW